MSVADLNIHKTHCHDNHVSFADSNIHKTWSVLISTSKLSVSLDLPHHFQYLPLSRNSVIRNRVTSTTKKPVSSAFEMERVVSAWSPRDNDHPGDHLQDDPHLIALNSPRNKPPPASFNMVSSNSQDNGPPSHDPQEEIAHNHDAQNDNTKNDDEQDDNHENDDIQNDDPQNGDPQTTAPDVFSFPHGHIPTSSLERCITTSYTILTSVLSNLNRWDFRNLQLAGIKTGISRPVQRKYLIPSTCNQKFIFPREPGGQTVCCNTTQTVDEIRTCHGRHDDDSTMSYREKWVEPSVLSKHIRGQTKFVDITDENQGGHFDSFNVCLHCIDHDREVLGPCEEEVIGRFKTRMCQVHALEHVENRPYNVCRCMGFVRKYWRCRSCAIHTLYSLEARCDDFWGVKSPTWFFEDEGDYPEEKCPIADCPGEPWFDGPMDKQMWMCRSCTAIFPRQDDQQQED